MSSAEIHGYPTIYLTPTAKFKMDRWTKKAEGEISGFGLIEEMYEDKILTAVLVRDVYLAEQICSAAHTTIDDVDLAKLIAKLSQDPTIKIGQVRLWWHSHADNGVFWSGTDVSTSANLSEKGECNTLSIVVNKKGESKAKYIMMNPIVMTLDDLPVKLYLEDKGLIKAVDEEFEGKIIESYISPSAGYTYDQKTQTWSGHEGGSLVPPAIAGTGGAAGSAVATTKEDTKAKKENGGGNAKGSGSQGKTGTETSASAQASTSTVEGTLLSTEDDLETILLAARFGELDPEVAFFKIQTILAASLEALEKNRNSKLDEPPFTTLKAGINKALTELASDHFLFVKSDHYGGAGHAAFGDPGDFGL